MRKLTEREQMAYSTISKLEQQRDELISALKVAANFIPATAIHEFKINFDGDIQDQSVSVKRLLESAIAKAEQ